MSTELRNRMPVEAPLRPPLGQPGDDDLPSVSCRAHAGGDVNGQTMYPTSVSVGRPLWTPIRTRTGRLSARWPVQTRLASSRWIATAASMAAVARAKTAKNSSARASISRPLARETAALRMPLTSFRRAP